MAEDYEVGYGKPPAQHRFKPGNQAARKRTGASQKREPVVTLTSVVQDVMRAKRKAKRGDAVIKLTMAEILRERLIGMIMSGSHRDVITALQIMERLLPPAPASDPEPLEIHLTRAEGSRVELPTQALWQKPVP